MRGAEVLERGEYLRGGSTCNGVLERMEVLERIGVLKRGGGGKYLRGEWVLETPINLFDLRCLKSKLCFFFTF